MRKVLAHAAAVLVLAAAPLVAQQSTPTGSQEPPQARSTQQSEPRSVTDAGFIYEAAQGGLAEVELGRLASEKASKEQVKQYGQRMVEDHEKANGDLMAMGPRKGVTVPFEPDAAHKAALERLEKLSGESFDRAFMQQMVEDHRKMVDLFRAESASGKDAEVKSFASKMLASIQEHYKQAQDISRGIVGTSGSSPQK